MDERSRIIQALTRAYIAAYEPNNSSLSMMNSFGAGATTTTPSAVTTTAAAAAAAAMLMHVQRQSSEKPAGILTTTAACPSLSSTSSSSLSVPTRSSYSSAGLDYHRDMSEDALSYLLSRPGNPLNPVHHYHQQQQLQEQQLQQQQQQQPHEESRSLLHNTAQQLDTAVMQRLALVKRQEEEVKRRAMMLMLSSNPGWTMHAAANFVGTSNKKDTLPFSFLPASLASYAVSNSSNNSSSNNNNCCPRVAAAAAAAAAAASTVSTPMTARSHAEEENIKKRSIYSQQTPADTATAENRPSKRPCLALPADYQRQTTVVLPAGSGYDKVLANNHATAVAGTGGVAHDDYCNDEFGTVPLGLAEDANWLSEVQCILRADYVEVFQYAKKNTRVGIRCRWCVMVKPEARLYRSAAFPSSIPQLYQSFTMMVREHFGTKMCPSLPKDKRERLECLKTAPRRPQGAFDSKHYWIYAAKKIGMIDTPSGIQITKQSRAAGLRLRPFGSPVPGTQIAPSDKAVRLLVQPKDATLTSRFLYVLLLQTQLVHLQPSEKIAKRKALPLGMNGIGCRYCCAAERYGFSRRFPLRRRNLPEELKDMYGHLKRCPLCPSEVKQTLAKLQEDFNSKNSVYAEDGAPSLDVFANGRIKRPGNREFYDLIWSRLNGTGDRKTDFTAAKEEEGEKYNQFS